MEQSIFVFGQAIGMSDLEKEGSPNKCGKVFFLWFLPDVYNIYRKLSFENTK